MILNRQPLSLNEVQEIIKEIPDSDKKIQMELYLKKFLNLSKEQAEKIKQNLKKLELMKINEEHITKILDLLPENASDLNKIFTEISLNEDEINQILEAVKNIK